MRYQQLHSTDRPTRTGAIGPHATTRILVALVALALPAAAVAKDDKKERKAPDPPREMRVEGGDEWQSRDQFTVSWSNPEHDHEIDVAYYRLCAVDAQRACDEGKAQGRGIHKLSIQLPAPGDYTLTAYLKDARGRSDSDERSEAVHLRFDDQPPTSPGIEVGADGDPARISLEVADRLSGPGETEIELRGPDGESRSLPVERSAAGDRVTARIPDLELPDGSYEVRATVRDLAGNLAVIEGDTDVRLPLRERTAIAAQTQVTRTVRRCRSVVVRVRGRLTRRLSCRNVAVSEPVAFTDRQPLRIPAGQRLLITGVLDGAPSGAAVLVAEHPRTPGMAPRMSQVRAEPGGRFAAALEPGPSRTVELSYAGGEDSLASVVRGSFLVPASGTLVASRGLVANGQSVRFTGRLAGPLPEIGRTVDLQAFYRGAWRTFATPRTDAAGAWSYVYRFGATRADVVYPFRVLIQREAGYPYETGLSRVVRVTVRGR